MPFKKQTPDSINRNVYRPLCVLIDRTLKKVAEQGLQNNLFDFKVTFLLGWIDTVMISSEWIVFFSAADPVLFFGSESGYGSGFKYTDPEPT